MKPFLAFSNRRHRDSLAEATDRELLAALGRDDEAAFDELMRRKTRPLLALGRRVLGDAEEARDVVQLTFLRVWQHRRDFNPRWTPNTWLYRIATNLAIDQLRSRRSRQRVAEPVRRHLRAVADDRRRRQVGRLRGPEVRRILEELSAELSERQRAVFWLREVEGMSSREVGRVLGCKASTVRNHLFAARRVLRRELIERYPEYAGAYRRAEEEA